MVKSQFQWIKIKIVVDQYPVRRTHWKQEVRYQILAGMGLPLLCISIAGISPPPPPCTSNELAVLCQFPLLFNSGRLTSASNQRPVSTEKCGKTISHGWPGCEWLWMVGLGVNGCEWLAWVWMSFLQLYQFSVPLIWISHIFCLKLLKPVFC